MSSQQIPYMFSTKNLTKVLDAIQTAACPAVFGLDFLKDLGFTSSNDRSVIKLLKHLSMLNSAGNPTDHYKRFMDRTVAKVVLAEQMRTSYRDLFISHKDANSLPNMELVGWFRTKTGASDAVAQKMATTFKVLASYSDFSQKTLSTKPTSTKVDLSSVDHDASNGQDSSGTLKSVDDGAVVDNMTGRNGPLSGADIGLIYRIEIHLPDTKSLDTYRAIFRALREELQ